MLAANQRPFFIFQTFLFLNHPGFFENAVGTAFADGLNGAGGQRQGNGFLQFGNVNALFLEIWVFSYKPGEVEFGRAGSIGVTASDNRTLL